MNFGGWPCPLPGGGTVEEHAVSFDDGRAYRLLIVPALFDEANRLRRLTVEVMRRLDGAGIDCFLPDLPGTNESLVDLKTLTLDDWRSAVTEAAAHFRASHVLAIRGGALLTPHGMQGWHYAPARGAQLLRQMIRARIFAAREAGRNETHEGVLDEGAVSGLELAGYRLSAQFVDEFQYAVYPTYKVIDQDMVGGAGLWLRAEPDEDRTQADTLASVIAVGMKF